VTTKKTAKKTTKKKPVAKVKKAKGAPKAKRAAAKPVAKAGTQRKRATNGPGKRSPEELTALKDRIVARVDLASGVTGEELAKALGSTAKELAMPLRQLRAAGTLTTTGQRRFLRYFPRGKAPKEVATPKGKAKK